jgi:hypothetical protein
LTGIESAKFSGITCALLTGMKYGTLPNSVLAISCLDVVAGGTKVVKVTLKTLGKLSPPIVIKIRKTCHMPAPLIGITPAILKRIIGAPLT